jgi:hypothetical protein
MSHDILDADALLAEAQNTTGLSDYGDDAFPGRFRLAVSFLKGVNMDEAGQRAGASVCLWLLTSRLELFEDRKRYPIGQERIEKPLFAPARHSCTRCSRSIPTAERCDSGK